LLGGRREELGAPRAEIACGGRCDTDAIGAVPLTIALAAGGLSVLNPCGFPLLPAFLSFYLGAEEERLPSAPTRVLQGVLVGALVAAGFLGVFALVGLPVGFGVGAVADAVDWVGLATGVGLALAGVAALAGRRLHLPAVPAIRARRERRIGAMLLFGVGYGAASLGCTLPILLALVGASLGADKLAVFGAYGAGMAVVLMALAVAVALAREGLARRLRPLLPHVSRLAALLLLVSGGYLTYYWARIRFGDQLTLADDPIVGMASRYAAQLESFARGHGTPLLLAAAAIVALALASGLLHLLRRRALASGEPARR
jgi:cytochrome c-type biogenesis protein